MGQISAALAAEHEAPACLALLPEVQGLAAELLIARHNGEFAGAAAVVWRSWSQPGGFPVWVQVMPAHRRAGIGRRLLRAAADLAAGESPGLWSVRAVPEEGTAAQFMRSCGLVQQRRQHHFIADVAPLLDEVVPQAERLRARGRVPADAAVLPLAEAPLEAVSWLVSAEFGNGPIHHLHDLRRRVGGGEGAPSRRDRSLVAMQGGRVAGVLLCRVKDGVVVVDGWITAPGWRNGWASALLLEAILLRTRRDGFEEFRFHCDDSALHTLRLARRCAAVEVARLGLFYYAIAAD